ncbi:hypothetical protein OIV83_001351 [Microbotryomycetes sp. JL201]|nr:hypothetical protein OIV83_001351 [Microbotryomycetes sp. JL201]
MPPRSSMTSFSHLTTATTNGTTASRKHVTRSCTSCRRRKVRCSGDQPCSSCVLYKEECSYDSKHDGRKTASKSYVAALEQRVNELEALLAAKQVDRQQRRPSATGLANEMPRGQATSRGAVPESTVPPDSSELSAGVEQLRIDDATGEYRLYGHASSFMHLPTPHAALKRGPSASLPLKTLPPGFTLSGKQVPTNTFLCPSHPPPHPSMSSSPPSLADSDSGLEHVISTFDIDWSLNLPLDVPGLDRQLHDELVELFLNYGNTWKRFVNAQLFLQDLQTCLSKSSSQRPVRTSYYSPLMHNSLLAVASAFSPRPIDAELFATKAKSLIEEENEVPLLSSVQGLFLLAEYYAGEAKQKKGWLFYGIGNYSASNLGLAVSLHPLAEKGLITAQVKNEREATFATWLLLDKLWSCLLGRQPILFRRTYETALPAIDPAIDARRWYPNMHEKSLSMPSYGSTTHRYAASLMDVLERILETFYAFRASLYAANVIEKVSAFHLELERWYGSLPDSISISPYTQKQYPNHVITLHALFWFVVVLLHRPYFSRPEGKPMLEVNKTAVLQCERAASKIVNLVEMHRRLPSGLRYSTVTLTQISFLSGTVHVLSAINASSQNAPKKFDSAVSLARACVGHLDEMGQSWKCAQSSADILRRLIVEWCVLSDGDEDRLDGGSSGVKRRRLTADNDDEPRDMYRKFWDKGRDDMEDANGVKRESVRLNMSDLPATFLEDVPVGSVTAAGLKPVGLYDACFLSDRSPAQSAASLASQATPIPTFTRYQPPSATLPPQFDPAFAPVSVPSLASDSSAGTTPFSDAQGISFMFDGMATETTASINDAETVLMDRVDPFATENLFAVFQGQDQWSSLGNMTIWSSDAMKDFTIFGGPGNVDSGGSTLAGEDAWLTDMGFSTSME